MYHPDRSIVKQLREIDPDLGAMWDKNKSRWWVTVKGKPTIVVRNEDNSYRPLDTRIVTRMRKEAWQYRNRRFRDIDAEEEEGNLALERSRYLSRRDAFRQYCIEDIHPRVVGFGSGRNIFSGWGGAK